jgi:guanine nucleotide-binding protein alpha-1 subunit
VRSIRTITDALTGHRRPPVDSGGEESENELQGIPRELELLTMRLLPLSHIEALLIAKLVPPNEDEATHLGYKGRSNASIGSGSDRSCHAQEVFVRGASSWKGVLARGVSRINGRPISAGTTGLETKDEPQEVLHSCRKDIMALWSDPLVRDILRRRKIRLEEFPGLWVIAGLLCLTTHQPYHSFLNDLERVTSLRYMPNDGRIYSLSPAMQSCNILPIAQTMC